ncbi:Mitochondrial ribosome small subunit biogenesis protein [Neocucurbitaria cava]|uniref:Mitochondrial ribosome small subunit biogenesis protein n=1 Tax=Neocucurbitaria cava TaxID=798079 RepID=A0A9W8Y6V4_9PLEO|nr:Mitochondrial ribosome small subunit biogenesis protein [Neocucurbitaria cava]
MKHRINSDRYTLKPGQSLILGGGLIRITPAQTSSDLVFLVHPFVPLHPHVTRTEKAIAYQRQTSDRHLQQPPILAPNVGDKMYPAGTFPLKWDVTKKLAGPVTSSVAGKMKPENLPYRIWGTDILVEGVGWIEISAQTRRPQGWKAPGMVKKDPNHAQVARRASLQALNAYKDRKFAAKSEGVEQEPRDALSREFGDGERMVERRKEWEEDEDEEYPAVEVFSPLGKFVGQRRPMCASVVSGPKRVASRERKVRPRRSMVSVKRQRKPKGAE